MIFVSRFFKVIAVLYSEPDESILHAFYYALHKFNRLSLFQRPENGVCILQNFSRSITRYIHTATESASSFNRTNTTKGHTKLILTDTTVNHSYKSDYSSIDGQQVRPSTTKPVREKKTLATKDALVVQKTQIPIKWTQSFVQTSIFTAQI